MVPLRSNACLTLAADRTEHCMTQDPSVYVETFNGILNRHVIEIESEDRLEL